MLVCKLVLQLLQYSLDRHTYDQLSVSLSPPPEDSWSWRDLEITDIINTGLLSVYYEETHT